MPATVLLVDDDSELRRLLARSLEGRFHVRQAGSAREAREALRAGPVDLVLLDLHLPPDPETPQEGFRVQQFVRERFPATPVVVLSGDTEPATRRALREAGARAFLAKPVDPRELHETLEAVLGERTSEGNFPGSP